MISSIKESLKSVADAVSEQLNPQALQLSKALSTVTQAINAYMQGILDGQSLEKNTSCLLYQTMECRILFWVETFMWLTNQWSM